MRHSEEVKKLARKLRSQGHSLTEIARHPGISVPKPTISNWCKDIVFSDKARKRLESYIAERLKLAHENAALRHHQKKVLRKASAANRASDMNTALDNAQTRKAVLATLYLGEGSKGDYRGGLTFGNSDPGIIKLFLNLLRSTFELDESKFRCTVQARASQNITELEQFWRKQTGIPRGQFYGARIDPRSVGKITKKESYKGVCRIDYFSKDLLYEMLAIGTILVEGP